MFEPTEKMKLAYRRVVEDGAWAPDGLADLAQHATAAALEAEHKFHCGIFSNKCDDCKRTKSDWLRFADEKLREVKR